MAVIKLRSGKEIMTKEYHIDTLGRVVKARCNGRNYFIPFESIDYISFDGKEESWTEAMLEVEADPADVDELENPMKVFS